jgi:hypothetical protein
MANVNSFDPGALFSFSSDSNFSLNYTSTKVVNDPVNGSSNTTTTIKAQFDHKKKPTTGIRNETSSLLPDKFKLFQNFPNPFNPTTVITYELPASGFVTLRVYDMLGRGDHSVRFDASFLPSGVYFYRLQAGISSETKKLLLLK